MNLKNKKIYFLGDSITFGSGATDFKGFVDMFKNETNADVINYGVSGTRFAIQKEEFNYDFDETFLDRAKRIKKDADILFIFGGTNDFGHGDSIFGEDDDNSLYTFKGATNELFKYISENFQNSRIILLTPLHRTSEYNELNDLEKPQIKNLNEMVNYERKIAIKYNFEIIDLYENDELNPLKDFNNTKYFMDGLHPNDSGHKLISEAIIKYLEQ